MPASCLKTTHPLSKKNYCHAVNSSRHTPSNHQHSSTTPRQNQTITRKRYKNSPSRFPPPFPHSPQKATPTKTQQFPPPPTKIPTPPPIYIQERKQTPYTTSYYPLLGIPLSLSLSLSGSITCSRRRRRRRGRGIKRTQPSPAQLTCLLTFFLSFFQSVS